MLFIISCSLSATKYKPLVTEDEALKNIAAFAKEMAELHQFDEKQLYEKLSRMQHRQDIIQKISKTAESMPWHRYRKIWMKEQRIDAGVEFWQQHTETLLKAQQVYGVDPAIIVGIIGVETYFGRYLGKYPVIEALHTLGFYYPKRAAFFRRELAEYLLLARQQEWALDQIKGSYAGAMGMGQFISSSYRNYAVDFNQDGKINLFSDPVDMIGSVANYFKRHRWQAKGFVAEPIELLSAQKKLVQKKLSLSYRLDAMAAEGIDVKSLKQKSTKAGIFAFARDKKVNEHWLVGDNFYVITRYNHNAMYALAVFQLSEAIKHRYQKTIDQS